MMRSHRRVHRALWPVLATLVAAAFIMALALREPPPGGPAPAAQETPR